MKKEPLTIHGSGNQRRDWIHTSDTCKCLDALLHHTDFPSIKNQVIQIGTGESISVLDVAKMILKYFDLSEDYLTFVNDRPGQVDSHIASIDKIKKLIQWKPEIPFIEGINQVINWYINNEHVWKRMETMMYVPIHMQNTIELQ